MFLWVKKLDFIWDERNHPSKIVALETGFLVHKSKKASTWCWAKGSHDFWTDKFSSRQLFSPFFSNDVWKKNNKTYSQYCLWFTQILLSSFEKTRVIWMNVGISLARLIASFLFKMCVCVYVSPPHRNPISFFFSSNLFLLVWKFSERSRCLMDSRRLFSIPIFASKFSFFLFLGKTFLHQIHFVWFYPLESNEERGREKLCSCVLMCMWNL